jgi:uncharacterized protein
VRTRADVLVRLTSCHLCFVPNSADCRSPTRDFDLHPPRIRPVAASARLRLVMAHISNDWLSREFQQNIQYNIQQVAILLNTFDTATRFKLAALNEKLTKIERQVEYIECALKNITAPENADPGAGGGS